MREELKGMEVNEVTGGSVILSQPMGICGFSALQRMFKIKGTFKEMRNRLLDLADENQHLSPEAFDTLVMNDFKEKGWI